MFRHRKKQEQCGVQVEILFRIQFRQLFWWLPSCAFPGCWSPSRVLKSVETRRWRKTTLCWKKICSQREIMYIIWTNLRKTRKAQALSMLNLPSRRNSTLETMNQLTKSMTQVRSLCINLSKPSSLSWEPSPTLHHTSVFGPCLWPTLNSPRSFSRRHCKADIQVTVPLWQSYQ